MPATDPDELPEGSQLAALDIGSNSFHLIVARYEHGELRPTQVLGEKVQLGAGLKNGRLEADAIQGGAPQMAMQPPAQMAMYGQQPQYGQQPHYGQPVYGQPAAPSTYSAPVAHAPGGK